MARTKQTAHKSKPTPGMATYQGGTVSSSEEEVEAESTITETQAEETAPTQERESSEPAGPSRPSRKRRRGDRTASSSLPSAESHRKTRKVAIQYSTDETDEEKVPEMIGEGYGFPRKIKQVKLTLPATPSQVTLPRTFVEWFSYYGMRPSLRRALESRQWTEDMINTFISNFREKHGFNKHTAMLPYNDEGDSKEEPIRLEGGCRVVLRRKIISPRDSSTPEEGDDRLDDLVSQSRKRPAANLSENTGPMGPPAKKRKKEKKARGSKPEEDPRPKKTKKKKAKKQSESNPQPVPLTGEGEPGPGLTPRGEPCPSADPLHPQPGDTPPQQPEGDPTLLGMEPQFANVEDIPLPPGTPPARGVPLMPRQPSPQREPTPPCPPTPLRQPTPPCPPTPKRANTSSRKHYATKRHPAR